MDNLHNNLKAYRLLFVFENNLRRFIKTELEKSLGQNWFTMIDPTIQSESIQQKKDIIQYLTTNLMDNNPLNYTLLSNLRNIVYEKWNNVFSSFFYNVSKNTKTIKPIVERKLLEIEKQRNFLNHNNLSDYKFLTQLEANINFFKTYIPQYDETIYSSTPLNGTVIKNFIEINSKIENYENIPGNLLEEIKDIDSSVYNILSEYNQIPKTKDKMIMLKEFIHNHNLVIMIKSKIGI